MFRVYFVPSGTILRKLRRGSAVSSQRFVKVLLHFTHFPLTKALPCTHIQAKSFLVVLTEVLTR